MKILQIDEADTFYRLIGEVGTYGGKVLVVAKIPKELLREIT